MELDEQLFRRESGRIVTVLTRIFGFQHLTLAEDVAQDVFCRALEVWKLRGVPENPSAWLMKAAKNRAIDLLRRERAAHNAHEHLGQLLQSEWTMVPTIDALFSYESIKDDVLRMMFSCCDPALPEQAQVPLILQVLCGFTSDEIAAAFLCKRDAVAKRIERGKKVLAASNRLFDMAENDVPARLSAVHRALYLLFNEGYHGASKDTPVRAELCREAMRLGALLLDDWRTSTPATAALCALMCLNAARLPARIAGDGELVAFSDQDRSQWDESLIAKGLALLERAAQGTQLSEYHIQAAIAAAHAQASSAEDTDWARIVWLYDMLMEIAPSPVVALNRAIALAEKDGPQAGVAAINAIEQSERLAAYPFLRAALGELELRAGNVEAARRHFEDAVSLARNAAERRFLESRRAAAT